MNDEASGLLFIDFKKAFDSVNRAKLYAKMQAFGIADRIIKLVEAIHKYSRTELGGVFQNLMWCSSGITLIPSCSIYIYIYIYI